MARHAMQLFLFLFFYYLLFHILCTVSVRMMVTIAAWSCVSVSCLCSELVVVKHSEWHHIRGTIHGVVFDQQLQQQNVDKCLSVN